MASQKFLKLKGIRAKLGMTLRDLEKKVGVSRQALSAYERGMFPPIEEHWRKLKKVLGLSGTVEDWWGRESHVGQPVIYDEDAKCKVDGCDEHPIAKGYCRSHYNHRTYMRSKNERVRKRVKGAGAKG